MRDKYGKDNVVLISVAMDDASDAGTRKSLLGIVAKAKWPIVNVQLAGDDATRPKTVTFGLGVPRAFVFDRSNRAVEQQPVKKGKDDFEDFSYEAIEKRVAELAKKGAR